MVHSVCGDVSMLTNMFSYRATKPAKYFDSMYTVSQKNWTLIHLSITLANTVRF